MTKFTFIVMDEQQVLQDFKNNLRSDIKDATAAAPEGIVQLHRIMAMTAIRVIWTISNDLCWIEVVNLPATLFCSQECHSLNLRRQ